MDINKKTNNLKIKFPMILLLLYSIFVNLVNFIINYHSKGYASLFYILLTITLFYFQFSKKSKPIYFYSGGAYFGYMGTINIMNKYNVFSDSIFRLLYYIPTIIFLFIGAFIIGTAFRERK